MLSNRCYASVQEKIILTKVNSGEKTIQFKSSTAELLELNADILNTVPETLVFKNFFSRLFPKDMVSMILLSKKWHKIIDRDLKDYFKARPCELINKNLPPVKYIEIFEKYFSECNSRDL
jgi:hypothetical protein